jgi:hypothetical protein
MTTQLYEEQQEVIGYTAADVQTGDGETQSVGPAMSTQTEAVVQQQIRKLQRQVDEVINAARK